MVGVRELAPEEDQALRLQPAPWAVPPGDRFAMAFGRFAAPAARAAGAVVVRRYQHAGAGHWFCCDCLGPSVSPPVLVPVAEAHIRRHQDPPWPAHAEACDFYRDPDEQRLFTRSYSRGRSALATLLAELLVRAGLNRIGPDGSVPAIAEQFRSLRAAAKDIPIGRDVLLSEFLCTNAPVLPELLGKGECIAPARFRRTRRPHGVLLAVVSGVSPHRLGLLESDAVMLETTGRADVLY